MMIQDTFLPICVFQQCSFAVVNDLLMDWNHKMGPITHVARQRAAHILLANGEPIAAVTTSTLCTAHLGGGLVDYTRNNTIELSRLCASRPHICRVALRLWREFVFTDMAYEFAASYQDADLHNGNTYRFDGWKRMGGLARSGVDGRSGRIGRNKYIWIFQRQKK